MAGNAAWLRPMGARGRGRSQTRKAVGAGSRDDNLSSPLRDELGHALLVARRPRPARPCGWPGRPSRSASSSCPRGGGGADTCGPQACSDLGAADRRLARGPARAAPLRREPAVGSRRRTAHYLTRRDPAPAVTCPPLGADLGRGACEYALPPHGEVARAAAVTQRCPDPPCLGDRGLARLPLSH